MEDKKEKIDILFEKYEEALKLRKKPTKYYTITTRHSASLSPIELFEDIIQQLKEGANNGK